MNRRVSKVKRRQPPIEQAAKKHPSIALVVAVVLTAILEVLDITIVTVAMPHMLGAFGATSDQITWVLTSYLVCRLLLEKKKPSINSYLDLKNHSHQTTSIWSAR